MALNEKQRRFVAEYLVDRNATAAAKRAGYSERSAHAQGHDLLKHPEIGPAIAEAEAKRSERTGITADVVLYELLRLARVDISEAFDSEGNLLHVKDMPEDVRRAISSIDLVEEQGGVEMTETGEVQESPVTTIKKIRFWDKKGALELLGKHLKLFVDRIEVDGPNALADRLEKARKRKA